MASKEEPAEPSSFSSPSFSIAAPTRWWSTETVSVVTGANRGIGFEVVKKLAEVGVTVILTSRDIKKGQKAVDSLKAFGLSNVHFSPLDVSNPSSIQQFSSWLYQNFGGLDILVNNAAVSFNEINENSVEHAETVINTNFYGSKLLIESLLPLFRRSSSSSSRILNISSRLGLLNKLKNPTMKEILKNEETLTEEKIDKMVRLFLENVKNGTWKNEGWPEIWTDYAVSKLALNAYSIVLAKKYKGKGLSVNCFCPGFTQTSMTNGQGTHTAAAAANMVVALALLSPAELPTGKFYLGSSRGVHSRL